MSFCPTLDEEIFGLFMGLDAAIVLRSLVSEILYATPLKEMVVDVRNDNLTVVRSVHQMGNMTTEKRLQGLIQSMKLMPNSITTKCKRNVPDRTECESTNEKVLST